MALNFPSSPAVGQIYTDSVSGFSYEWNGTVWISFSPASSSQIKPLDDISGSFDDVTQTFALTTNSVPITSASPQSLIINLGGIIQDSTDDYSVSGSNIIFSTPPTSGLSFSGISLGPAVPVTDIIADAYEKKNYTATAGQTLFNFPALYTVGFLDVYQNGVRLTAGTDFTATTGSSFTLTTPANLSDEIEAIGYRITSQVSTNGDLDNLFVTGISTLGNTIVGGGTTQLVVNGDTRITGILTIGTSSITLNGSTNDIQVGSINNGPLSGMRNAIINGNFDIWQRGTSFTGLEYGADRWVHGRVGTTHTVTRQAFTVGQTAVPGEPTYFWRTVVASVAGASNFANLSQRIEDVRTFAGQQITVSFWAKADATKNISFLVIQNFGTGGSPSAGVDSGITKVSIGTTFQKVTVTLTVPSISGKTLGTNNDHSLSLVVWFDAGSSFNARTDSLGQQSGTFDIAQVQIEAGPVATPFERRPIGTELALCQRYFEIGRATVQAPAANSLTVPYSYHTIKRAAPTVTTLSVGSDINIIAPAFTFVTNSAVSLQMTATAAGGFRADWGFTIDAEL